MEISAASRLEREDYKAIRQILIDYREAGNPDPLLPMDVDINGDGIVDSWALNSNDQVVVRLGTALTETVYVSQGDDVDLEGKYSRD